MFCHPPPTPPAAASVRIATRESSALATPCLRQMTIGKIQDDLQSAHNELYIEQFVISLYKKALLFIRAQLRYLFQQIISGTYIYFSPPVPPYSC